MQPLKDNLTSQVYEIFEKDKKKYEQYEKAINKYFELELKKRECEKIGCKKMDNCSIDFAKTMSETFDNMNNNYTNSDNEEFVIFVVGAGRGPLVDCTINALEKNKIKKYEIYAIEKNENVILILKNRSLKARWKNVKVINSDMRQLKIKKKADLIVSELLGSFGDNELFPECLDGVQHYLKKNGISIPQNCISFLEPISCSSLYYKICNTKLNGNNENFYVVNLYSYCNISKEGAKECFYFEVPNNKYIKSDGSHNNRYKTITFHTKFDSNVHGFLCYFKSLLYHDIYISIEPTTHTTNMHSWFPLFIPLNKSIYLKSGQLLSLSIWRLSDKHKVWYEWCINEPTHTIIHNFNAKYFTIGK
uniref:Protein arginine N-methyltransferase 5 n=1 Tax=Piliocolobus tephrosceles TaxID=591936 RepID=A0A8C9LHA9_9PRIM